METINVYLRNEKEEWKEFIIDRNSDELKKREIFIDEYAYIGVGVHIGNRARIGDSHIGDRTIIGSEVIIKDNVYIGDNIYIGGGSIINNGIYLEINDKFEPSQI